MKIEHKSFEEYWSEIGHIFGVEDSIRMRAFYPEDNVFFAGVDWEEYDEIIEFRDSCGYLLSAFNIDKGVAYYV